MFILRAIILVLALVLGISFSKTKDEIKEPIKL